MLGRRDAPIRLERLHGGGYEYDLVEPEHVHDLRRGDEVPVMDGVEGSAA